MKKIIAAIAALLPCLLMAQGNYTINGTVTGKAPAKVFFSLDSRSGKFDSVTVVNGKYAFAGRTDDVCSSTVFFWYDDTPFNPDESRDYMHILVDGKGTINIASADSVKNATITGSKINDDRAELKRMLVPSDMMMDALVADYKAATPEQKEDEAFMDAIDKRNDEINRERDRAYKEFIASHPDSYVSLSAMFNLMIYEWDPQEMQRIFDTLSAATRSSARGKKTAEQIQAKARVSIGSVAPVFTQNDPDGKPVSLTDFRGKYLLIDFWASWCGPCRAENPNVVKAYEQYKDKNFEILGVSLDGEGQREAWLAAVKKDGLTWPQVSDLQGWSNAAAAMYSVSAVPANFLLDPQGRIVATNLRGEALEKKLAELLK